MCYEVINNFASAEAGISNAFFQQYFLSILQDIFFVLTDADHKSGFKMQSLVLARMFQLIESGQIRAPLFDPSSVTEPNVSNSTFLQDFCVKLLKSAFPHIQTCVTLYFPFTFLTYTIFFSAQVQNFVFSLGELQGDLNRFKLSLRDFLIQLKEFSGDNAELYLEEKEAEALKKAQAERDAAMRIPGMLKPSQLRDDEQI